MINTLKMAQTVILMSSVKQCIWLFVEESDFHSILDVNIFLKNDDSAFLLM